MDGTMLDNVGFPHREAMWVLSMQHLKSTKSVRKHGQTPYLTIAALANQAFIQSY